MPKIRRMIAIVVVLTAVITGGTVSTGAAAEPDLPLPTCTNTVSVPRLGLTFTLPAAGSNLDCVLGPRNPGTGVVLLQLSLNTCYYIGSTMPGRQPVLGSPLPVDGIYGPLMVASMSAVQRFHGITPSGEYGPETRRTILWPAPDDGARRCVRFGA